MEIGGCAIIVYVSPPLVLTAINYLPWIYSGWKIYSKFSSTYKSVGPVIGWAYGKIKSTKRPEPPQKNPTDPVDLKIPPPIDIEMDEITYEK